MKDKFNLERFIAAQETEIDSVRAELMRGCKLRHWMWFVFPQLKGLGKSWMADHYAISSRAEAEAYLRHPILGRRLVECTELVNLVEGRSIQEILGEMDSVKFRSSMTLFAELNRGTSVFSQALDKYFAGQRDLLTLDLLKDANRT